jgi:hypothetical protein
LPPLLVAALAGAQPPKPAVPAGSVAESLLPLLAYGPSCSSTVELRNLGDTPVDVELEGHRASGALAPLVGHAGRVIHMLPGEQGSYQLQIPEKEIGAWVRVRERTAAGAAPAVAVSGSTECRQGDELHTVPRDVAFPTRDPWFESDVEGLSGALIAVLNASAGTVRVSVCYAGGSLYSVPGETQASRELRPVCSTSFEVRIPPFGSRYFPVESRGNSYFSLKTQGDSVVMQLLRPAKMDVRTYTVDSTIKFGGEVPAGTRH